MKILFPYSLYVHSNELLPMTAVRMFMSCALLHFYWRFINNDFLFIFRGLWSFCSWNLFLFFVVCMSTPIFITVQTNIWTSASQKFWLNLFYIVHTSYLHSDRLSLGKLDLSVLIDFTHKVCLKSENLFKNALYLLTGSFHGLNIIY